MPRIYGMRHGKVRLQTKALMDEIASLRAQLHQQAADLAQARQDLIAKDEIIEKLEAAFLKLYIDAMRGCGMPYDIALEHGRDALEAIRGGKA